MANITATQDKADLNGDIVWSSVTEADTALEAPYKGGPATVEVTGTFGGATVNMQWGSTSGTLQNIDTDAAPDGSKFTAAGQCNINLARGFLKPLISGGTSQSLKILVRPLTKKA